MKRSEKRYYKEPSLLTKRKAKNVIYVYCGCGYELTPVYTNRDEMTIDELAYICEKSNKGCFIPENEMFCDFDDNDDCNNDLFVYCDLSQYGLRNGYLRIDNIRCDNVDLHS